MGPHAADLWGECGLLAVYGKTVVFVSRLTVAGARKRDRVRAERTWRDRPQAPGWRAAGGHSGPLGEGLTIVFHGICEVVASNLTTPTIIPPRVAACLSPRLPRPVPFAGCGKAAASNT